MKNVSEFHQKQQHPVRILQFGEGNFLRAFVDYAVDVANEENGFDGSVAVVSCPARARPTAIPSKMTYTRYA